MCIRDRIRATKPVAFELTDKYAVTGKGAPSYVSGAHEWKGTIDILNPIPEITNIALSNTTGESVKDALSKYEEISEKTSWPVSPYRSENPYNISEADNTPNRKNFIAPSFDFLSPFFHPESKNIGVEASSIPINIVNKSLEELTMSAPKSELNSK